MFWISLLQLILPSPIFFFTRGNKNLFCFILYNKYVLTRIGFDNHFGKIRQLADLELKTKGVNTLTPFVF